MLAYMLIALKMDDRSWLGGYVPSVEVLIAKHGGRYIARAFYNDPDYEPHRKARLAAAKGDLFLMPGE